MQPKHILAAGLAAVAVTAQGTNGTQNLTQLISSNSDLSSLAALLGSFPNVTSQLAGASNITLFAPNNAALNAVMGSLGLSGGASGNVNGLVQALLQYHTLPGMIYASQISSTPAFPHTTLNNTMFTNVTGGQVVEARASNGTVEVISGLKSVANVTQANLNFTGGVVHVINNVLTVPLNFSATADVANLTALLGATEATNLTSVLDTAKDITIFAPSNDAFQAIGTAAAGLTPAQAASILEYHVINGTIAYSSSLANANITTLAGGNVTITVDKGSVFVNGARVINPDILISGGVLHIIDSVLNPNNTAPGNASQTAPVNAYSGATSASQVPFTSGVPMPSSTVAALVTTQSAVASGYSTVAPAGGASSSRIGAAGSSSSSAGAAMATGAVGAAALFGGAAFLANI